VNTDGNTIKMISDYAVWYL